MERYQGNPLAVVVLKAPISDAEMQKFAKWTNLSETTFLLPPSDGAKGGDYRVRIFTPTEELKFAGHPTLGTCSVWLSVGGQPKGDIILQECQVGLVKVKALSANTVAFAAPPLIKSGAVEDDVKARVLRQLNLTSTDDVEGVVYADNGRLSPVSISQPFTIAHNSTSRCRLSLTLTLRLPCDCSLLCALSLIPQVQGGS